MVGSTYQAQRDRAYYTAPWRKARICARILLNPTLQRQPRYMRIASRLAQDSSVTNRLIDQAIAHLKGRRRRQPHAA